MIKSRFSLIIVIGISLLSAIFTIIIKPYRKKCHNIRFVCNMVITSAIMGIYFYYNLSSTETRGTSTIIRYMPLIICILLIICVLYSAVFIIHSLVKNIKNKQYLKFIEKDEDEEKANH